MEPEKVNLRRLLLLPREIQIETLLRLSPDNVANLCENIPELSYICNDYDFWFIKAQKIGVTKSFYDGLKRKLDALNLYRYLEVMSDAADLLYKLDFEHHQNQISPTAEILALKRGYKRVAIFISGYEPCKKFNKLIYAHRPIEALDIIDNDPRLQQHQLGGCLLGIEAAIRKNYLNVIRAIFERGLEVDSKHAFNFILAAAIYNRLEILKYLLLKFGNLVDDPNSLIIQAIHSGYLDTIIELINFYRNTTPLSYYDLFSYSLLRGYYQLSNYILNTSTLSLGDALYDALEDYLITSGPELPKLLKFIIALMNRINDPKDFDEVIKRLIGYVVSHADISNETIYLKYSGLVKLLLKAGGKLTPEARDIMNDVEEDEDIPLLLAPFK